MANRTDLDYDGAGRPFYTPAVEDYISTMAAELGITEDEAAARYEAARLHEQEEY